MKKLLASLLLLISLPLQTLAASAPYFKPATLYKGQNRQAVFSESEANFLFARGYKLEDKVLGYSVVTAYSTTLSQSMTATQTTVPVSSLSTKDGHTLTMADLGAKVFLTIEPGAAKEEIVMCTTISGTAWATCTRGLAFYGTGVTAVTANQKTHASGSRVVMSNVHYVYEQLTDIDTDQTIAGIKTFTSSPIVPYPTTANQAANVQYVLDTVTGVAGTATTSTAGTVYMSSEPGTPNHPVALNSEEVATTSAASKVPRANGSGKIDPAYIDGAGNYTFSGNNTYSGTGTFSGINTFSNTNTFNGTTNFSTTTFSVFPTFPGNGFFKLAGSNTAEISTFSGSLTDVLTVSGLSIASTTPFQITANIGLAAAAQSRNCFFGLKFNSTQVVTSTIYNAISGVATDQEWQQNIYAFVPSRSIVTRPGFLDLKGWGGTSFTPTSTTSFFTNAAMPNVPITSITLGLYTSNTNSSCRASDLNIYTYPTQ